MQMLGFNEEMDQLAMDSNMNYAEQDVDTLRRSLQFELESENWSGKILKIEDEG